MCSPNYIFLAQFLEKKIYFKWFWEKRNFVKSGLFDNFWPKFSKFQYFCMWNLLKLLELNTIYILGYGTSTFGNIDQKWPFLVIFSPHIVRDWAISPNFDAPYFRNNWRFCNYVKRSNSMAGLTLIWAKLVFWHTNYMVSNEVEANN